MMLEKECNELLELGMLYDRVVHVNEVDNGKGCNCTCPKCKMPLIAKNKGRIRKAHFAHAAEYTCVGAVESAIHRLAKEILFETKKLYLPSYTKYLSENMLDMLEVPWNKVLTFERVDLEQRMMIGELFIVADAVCTWGSKKLLVEFAFTHFVDLEKRDRIKKLNVPCLEITLDAFTQEKKHIKGSLLNGKYPMMWISNPYAEKLLNIEEIEYRAKRDQERIERERSLEKERREFEKIRQEFEVQREKAIESRLNEARQKGELVLSCPAIEQILRGFGQTEYGRHTIIKELVNGVQWNDRIYGESPRNVEIQLGGKFVVIIPFFFNKLNEQSRKELVHRYHSLIRLRVLRRLHSKGSLPCQNCKLSRGFVYSEYHRYAICAFKSNLDFPDSFNYDFELTDYDYIDQLY